MFIRCLAPGSAVSILFGVVTHTVSPLHLWKAADGAAMLEALNLKAQLCTEAQRSSEESAAHAGHVVMSSAMSAPHPQAPIAVPEALTGATLVHDLPESQRSPLIIFIGQHVIIGVNKTPKALLVACIPLQGSTLHAIFVYGREQLRA